jgi:serine/threonine-protein kinase RsbW
MGCDEQQPHRSAAGEPESEELRLPGIPAMAERLPRLRHALVSWAQRTGLSDEQVQDLELASGEALANVVVHAYRDALPGEPGVLDLHAWRDPERACVTVTIVDYGQWRPPTADPAGESGRGLRLIHSLAPWAQIESRAGGTMVCLHWPLNDAQSRP